MQDSPIVLTTLAGLSTGVGGLLAVLCPPSERLLAASAGFAGGVMLTASLADLMPEVLAFYGGYLPPLACGGAVVSLLALGMLTAGLLGRLLPEEAALAARFGKSGDPARAAAIALHNIPEGLAVAVPFAYATRRRTAGVLAALVSGLAEPLGAVLAWLFLRRLFTPGFLNGTVVLAAGVMVWVALAQLLPGALHPAHRTAGILGAAVGCLLMLLGIAALP